MVTPVTTMAYLNFDWDDILPTDELAQVALQALQDAFGIGKVWHRLSSSRTGMHIMIAELSENLDLVPLDYDHSFVIHWRNVFLDPPYSLECQGRLKADRERSSHGFRIGRIFKSKNGATSGEWKCYGLE